MVFYWPVSISLILIPIGHNLWPGPWYRWGFSGGQTRRDYTHQSDHDHLKFAWPETALWIDKFVDSVCCSQKGSDLQNKCYLTAYLQEKIHPNGIKNIQSKMSKKWSSIEKTFQNFKLILQICIQKIQKIRKIFNSPRFLQLNF